MHLEHQTTPRLGLLGAGRLAQAIAGTWRVRTGEGLLVWSRSGPRLGTETRIAEGTWVTQWTSILEARSIVIAIPGKSLLELAEASEQAKQFTGNVFSAAASLSHASLVRAFPRATIICIAPFLINDAGAIPMLALRSSDLPIAQWEKAKVELDSFGDLDVVEDEEIFADLSLLGASWAAVVMAALEAAARAGVQRLHDEAAIDLGRRLFFRGLLSLLTNHAKQNGSGEIVTPGGITERGLKSLGDQTSSFESVFNQMRARASELRA